MVMKFCMQPPVDDQLRNNDRADNIIRVKCKFIDIDIVNHPQK